MEGRRSFRRPCCFGGFLFLFEFLGDGAQNVRLAGGALEDPEEGPAVAEESQHGQHPGEDRGNHLGDQGHAGDHADVRRGHAELGHEQRDIGKV